MRVNGSLLVKCINKPVSIIGTVQMVNPNNLGFDITTSDNYNVSVKLQKPVMDNVSGLIEIRGVATGPTSIACDDYITFPSELALTYDAAIDNAGINLGFRVSNAWL